MNDKFFMDSNILIYTFDSHAPRKQEKARELVATALKTQKGIISFQVVQEFLNVATRQFETPLTETEAEKYINQVLTPLCEVFSNMELYIKAVKIMERWQYSFYDSLIIAAA
jgi:predicted nucleic acid-binding protein